MPLRGKVVITCAVTGSIHTPTMSPHLPLTPDEIARDAIAAACADEDSWSLPVVGETFDGFLNDIRGQRLDDGDEILELAFDRVVGRILDWQIAGFGAAENFRVLLARKLAHRADSSPPRRRCRPTAASGIARRDRRSTSRICGRG